MTGWQKEEKIDKALKIFLFLVSPLVAALYALRNIKTKSSFVTFFLFAIFFGLSFTVESGKTAESRFDGASYREKFDRYINYGELLYYSRLKEYVEFEEGHKDFYFDTIAFFTSQLTHNYHFLFFIFAAVFAYFALKSFRFLTSEPNFTTSLSCLILAYLFMSNQIFNINGVRFWTAAWIGVYCIFQLIKNGDKRYLWLALLTPFVHSAFFLFVVVLLFGYFFKKLNHKLWVFLFLVSFLASNLSVELVRSVSDYLPPFLKRTAESYTDESYIGEVDNKGSGFIWVTEIFKFLVRAYMNLMVWLFIKNSKMILSNPKTSRLYPFLLIWMVFVNFTMPIPSLGGRFMMLAYPIIAYIWLVNFKGVKYQRLLFAMPIVFVFSFYTQAILYFKVLEPEFYISSPFYLIYKYLIIV